jgi:2-polyprenyl-6-methoxyphenol hydroxylase-like FAD-dependent oxidoreductase
VVIVGAGPSGLALASLLAANGVGFLLLERETEKSATSRAAVIHARTLEALEELGVSDKMRELGVVVPVFTIHDRGRTLLRVRFDSLPTKYPYTLMLPQSKTEALLTAQLEESGGQVHRGYDAVGVDQDASGAVVTVRSPDGSTASVDARYVVGADGMHSTVREAAGIKFIGSSYPQAFMLADVTMDWPRSRDQVELLLSPEGVTVIAPLPENRYRIVATVEETPAQPSISDVQGVLDKRGPGAGVKVHSVVWGSRFRVQHRVADHYRSGRLLLTGDAAHVHSPAGGQGMNTGIQDALTLGHALIGVLRDGGPDTLLSDYEKVRQPVAQEVVALADRLTRMATLKNPVGRQVRNTVVSALGRLPAFRDRLAVNLSELRYRSATLPK